MIRRSWSHEKWMLTHQPEHARLAGLIAMSWQFGDDRPSDEVLKAIGRHDDGWKEFDDEARINRNGDPLAFDEADAITVADLWGRSSKGLETDGMLYGARLVAGHFVHMAEHTIPLARLSPRGAVAMGKFIATQRRAMDEWSKAAKGHAQAISAKDAGVLVAPEQAQDEAGRYERDLRFLQICDQISLCMCTDFKGETEIKNVPYLEGSDTLKVARKGDKLALTLAPFPLKVKLRDHLASFLVAKKKYESDEELRQVLAETKPLINEVHFGKSGDK